MAHKSLVLILDTFSGTTFLFGMITGQHILMALGGLASLAAIINHTDAYLKRRKETKNKQP